MNRRPKTAHSGPGQIAWSKDARYRGRRQSRDCQGNGVTDLADSPLGLVVHQPATKPGRFAFTPLGNHGGHIWHTDVISREHHGVMAGADRENRIADRALRDQLGVVAEVESGDRRRGVPTRWIRDPTWRCSNLHVSKRFERDWHERRVCSLDQCASPVRLTFPEDLSGPLPGADRPRC